MAKGKGSNKTSKPSVKVGDLSAKKNPKGGGGMHPIKTDIHIDYPLPPPPPK